MKGNAYHTAKGPVGFRLLKCLPRGTGRGISRGFRSGCVCIQTHPERKESTRHSHTAELRMTVTNNYDNTVYRSVLCTVLTTQVAQSFSYTCMLVFQRKSCSPFSGLNHNGTDAITAGALRCLRLTCGKYRGGKEITLKHYVMIWALYQ